MSGALFIVSLPIGHPDDITARARAVLAQADLVAAEDTRNAGRVLDQLGLRKPLLSYHDHNEQERVARMLERLQAGESIALVSDAGTPLVSDPGYRIVRACHDAGVPVVPVPGASALLAALVAAGLPSDRFCFEGFLAPRGRARREQVARIAGRDCTSILYEAPGRILDLLVLLEEAAGPDREVALCRELTKHYETVRRGTLADLRAWVAEDANQQRGEIVLVLGPASGSRAGEQDLRELGQLLLEELPASRAARVLAGFSGRKRNEMYQLLENLADGAGKG